MRVYERVGSTILRRRRLLVVGAGIGGWWLVADCWAGGVALAWLVGVVASGPGWDASPIRVARRPYRALRCGLVMNCGVVGS